MKNEKEYEIKLESVNELFTYLRPENESKIFNKDPYKIIYRGQSNSDWMLKPSFFRLKLESQVSEWDIFYEMNYFKEFLYHCDIASIQVPNDSLNFRENNFDLNQSVSFANFLNKPYEWPNKQLYELMAFAQHYKVPTRLLDWSYRSYIAIYFAASGALKSIVHDKKFDDESRLAIWCLNIEEKNNRMFEVINTPSGVNKNIAAQSGCFTLLRQNGNIGKPFEGTHLLDKYLEEEYKKNMSDIPLKKITVPVKEAAAILKLCKQYGVTASRIYPDTHGVYSAMEDELNCWIFDEKNR